MIRTGIKIPSKKFHEFVENFMKSLGVKGLRVNKGHISPYCKNIIELCIKRHGADMRGYMLLKSTECCIIHCTCTYTGRGNRF